MLLEFDETTVSFDMNKGLPLDDIYGSQGVGFRRSFEIASFNNLYNFKGVRYRSQFSNLDQLGGRITTLEILPYDEFRYEYADVGVTLSFFPLMDPKIFQSLLKKGQEKATKKLLKGDDTFILNEVRRPQVVNGYNGNDYFSLGGDDTFSSSIVNGGKGEDYFAMRHSQDVVTGGKQSDIFHFTRFENNSTAKITDFEKGKDKVLSVSPFKLIEDENDTFIMLGDHKGAILKGVTGLSWEEEILTLPGNGRPETFWVLN